MNYHERRHQIFISSTFTDLQEERREVLQALLQMDAIPVGMKLFPAANEESSRKYIQQVIDGCDYYLLILGGRYGSTDEEGLGFTEKEHDYAVSKSLPVMAFVHGDPSKIENRKVEPKASMKKKLQVLRKKVEARFCKHWETVPQLVAAVMSTYPKFKGTNT